MIGFLGAAYPWILALHIISVIAWMAGLLYLPRLFVYHAEALEGGELSETLKIMERRLLRFIMVPAMIATWIFGLALFFHLGAWSFGWMHAKLALVLGLSAIHGHFAGMQRAFAQDRNRRRQRSYRIWNEVPTLILVLIVILVVVKPF